jgi:hypothetical protein
MTLLQSVICLALATLASALPTEDGAQGISFQNGDRGEPLLHLDYATYKGSYNNNTDVILAFLIMSKTLTNPDLLVQEHQICRTTSRKTTMAQTSTTLTNERSPKRI